MSAEICEVIITAPDVEWLTKFTRELVELRLCAGSHQVAPIRSIYRWDGEIHDVTEARVALHTRVSLVPRIIAKTNWDHPYDVPCVVATPFVAADDAYAQWILDETRPI